MLSQAEFIRWLVARLENAGIDYMVAGSVASTFYGEPRSTYDVDVVIDGTDEQIRRFAASIASESYVTDSAVAEAIRSRSQFNVIEYATGWKADLILRKNRPFSIAEFRRRRDGTPAGVNAKIASPEDVILSKLEWSIMGESERQVRDACNLYRFQKGTLDEAYLDKWAEELGVTDLLRRARESAI